jgi:SAM-dependent methyltransferase
MSFDVNRYLMPPRLKRFRSDVGDRAFNLLDVGCANGSAPLTRRWYPQCRYFGIDKGREHLSATEIEAMDEFFVADLEFDDLTRLPAQFFDVIVVAHVIEHLSNGLEVLARLTTKLAPGGRMYIEFPSARSLGLPSAVGGLQFCDDATHIRVYDICDVANALLSEGLTVVKAGRRTEYLRILLSPLTLPLQIRTLITQRRLHASGLWDLLGFADFVYARRRANGKETESFSTNRTNR